jgi:hypothetical protein
MLCHVGEGPAIDLNLEAPLDVAWSAVKVLTYVVKSGNGFFHRV